MHTILYTFYSLIGTQHLPSKTKIPYLKILNMNFTNYIRTYMVITIIYNDYTIFG